MPHHTNAGTPFVRSITDVGRMEVELDNLENETIQELEENASREALGLPVADSSGTGNCRFLPIQTTIEEVGKDVDPKDRPQQLRGNASARFTFTLKVDLDFECEIIVDVLQVGGGKPVLHAVDATTVPPFS
ncbi:hypothetical protein E4U24_008006 [Claviceps purpurea]|nr:hypothetical protein E4U24_008006 [Claviceps purpurea]